MSLRQTIDRYRAGKLSAARLMRALAEADVVHIPAIRRDYEVQPFTQGYAGGRRLDLYTARALCPYAEAASMSGAWALWGETIDVNRVTLDHRSDHELVFNGDQVTALHQWGRAVLVERWCASGEAPRAGAAILRSYRSFLGVIDETTTELRRHNDVVALFTARDALESWQQTHRGGTPWELRALQIAGLLDEGTPVVLNPAGPRGPLTIPESMRVTLAQLLRKHNQAVSRRRASKRK